MMRRRAPHLDPHLAASVAPRLARRSVTTGHRAEGARVRLVERHRSARGERAAGLSLTLAATLAVAVGGCPKITATPTPDASVDMTTVDQYVAPDVQTTSDSNATGEDAACATQSALAQPIPLDLYVMMDSSKSMLEPAGAGTSTSKWQVVRNSMSAFFNDAQSMGLSVGLQYFPQVRDGVVAVCGADTDCGDNGPCDQHRTCVRTGTTTTAVAPFCDATGTCTAANETCSPIGTCPTSDPTGYCAPTGSKCAGGDMCTPIGYCHARDVCDVAPYATPAVELAALPGAASALVASLGGRTPDGHTPTGPALSGALQHAQARAQANPDHKVATLLVTDGLPDGCAPTDIPSIATIAAGGAAASPAVPTFVIGVFSPTEAAMAATNLDALATAGGTGSAIVINTSQTEAQVAEALQNALNQVRTKALACEYKIPPPEMGAIDFGKVNVEYTTSAGAKSTIGYVANMGACDPTRGGWTYDVDPKAGGTPTSIRACDATCAQLKADEGGRVDIVLGCVTIMIN